MPTILVSYRRDDSKWITGRIVDRLKQHYGRDNVFMDIDAIPVGRDFREHLRNTLDDCDVLLAIIGPRWLVADRAGRPRIMDSADWVRVEIETALTKRIPVVPVLIDDAGMPRPDELPDSLQDFAYRQAAVIDTDRDFHAHMDRLIQGITGLASQPKQSPPPQPLVETGDSRGSPSDGFDALKESIAQRAVAPPIEIAEAASTTHVAEVGKADPPPTPAPQVAPSPPVANTTDGRSASAAGVSTTLADLSTSPSPASNLGVQRPSRRQWPFWLGGVGLGLVVIAGVASLINWTSMKTDSPGNASSRQPPAESASAPSAPSNRKITDPFEPNSAPSQPSQTAALAPSAAVPQRVVLYEEDPNDKQGKRFVGSAIWRTETVSSAKGMQDLAIRADVQIPERRIAMTWSLRHNADPALPASHTVEIVFKLPPDFPDGSVSNVPGVLMKQTEEARGTPLSGLAVKVTDGFFLVGLSAVDADRERNLQLLKEREWFDIPVIYNNNRRAILALEKGTPGERAFAEAFQAWRQ